VYKYLGDESDPYAIVILKDISPPENSVQFLTREDSGQQLGIMRRKPGHVIRAHKHNQITRTIKSTQEVLIILKGCCRIKIFNEHNEFIKECVISSGDIIMFARGGHSLEFIEDTTFVEVKQGPYAGLIDKEFI